MDLRIIDSVSGHSCQRQGEFAIRLFWACLVVFGLGGGLTYLLVCAGDHPALMQTPFMPAAFWLSTAILLTGSVLLHRSLWFVRIERQRLFRRYLLLAVGVGAAFVGVQGYGLWSLLRTQAPMDIANGVGVFLSVLVVLHGLHFTVALMFLIFVTLHALADRYDHEYYWGVTVCTFFWHFLGAVWLCILGVFATAW